MNPVIQYGNSGYLRKVGNDWRGYMSRADAENDRYCVGSGSVDDAARGINLIIQEMKDEQDFERRYS